MRPAILRPATLALTIVSVLASTACKEDEDAVGDLIARQTIGPDGGTLAGGGITLEVPANAVTADTDFELRTANRDLSVRDYVQSGGAYALYPEGLHLRLPAELSFASGPDPASVMFVQDELTVAAHGSTAWINELATFSIAKEGTPMSMVVEPPLGSTPDDAGGAIRDMTHFRVATAETPRFDLALTIYDTAQYYDKPLNGSGAGDCGFELSNVAGGSLSANCSEGPLTAKVGVTSAEISFDVTPFQSGKMEEAVVVGVVGGSDVLAYQLGFFAFDTSPCYAENCGGYGTCEVQGDTPQCTCIAGYEPGAELTCNCVPQCGGRECGSDSCDGFCPPGCADGETCTDEGQCVPDGSEETGPSDDGTTSDDGGMTTSDTGMATSTTDDGGMTSSGGGGSSSTGM